MSQKSGIATLPSIARNDIVYVGHFESTTRAMGPGLRACIWVLGCPIRCPGCATPEFIPMPEGHPYMRHSGRAARAEESRSIEVSRLRCAPFETTRVMVSVSDLCARLDRAITERHIDGVSFSGGEPFAQASALTMIARHARSCGLSTLAWSGWTREHLEGPHAPAGSRDLLAQLDVLIDGPYIRALCPQQPLRGSSNQRIHLLTDRYRPEDFNQATVEVRIGDDGIVISGVTDYTALRATLAAFGVR